MTDLQDALQALPRREAYHLDVPGTDSVETLSVVSFEATEKMGEPRRSLLRIIGPT